MLSHHRPAVAGYSGFPSGGSLPGFSNQLDDGTSGGGGSPPRRRVVRVPPATSSSSRASPTCRSVTTSTPSPNARSSRALFVKVDPAILDKAEPTVDPVTPLRTPLSPRQRCDLTLYPLTFSPLGRFQVVSGLQSEPEAGSHPRPATESQGGVRTDSTSPTHYLVEPLAGHAYGLKSRRKRRDP